MTTIFSSPLVSAVALTLVTFFSNTYAHDWTLKDIAIKHPFATPSPGGAKDGAAYAEFRNEGKAPDRLVAASSPVAERVEFHMTSIDNNVAQMRPIPAVELAPGAIVKMRPGQGAHMMLVNLKRPLKEGETFPIRLRFEKSGEVDVKAYVQQPRARGREAEMHKQH